MLINILFVFLSTVVGCVVTPLSPTTLTVAGGVLNYGTKNVRIQCNCTGDDGVVKFVRWFNPDGVKLISPLNLKLDSSVPHFTRYKKNSFDSSNVILVIPTFTYFYTGVYTCGERVRLPGTPFTTINLTLHG